MFLILPTSERNDLYFSLMFSLSSEVITTNGEQLGLNLLQEMAL